MAVITSHDVSFLKPTLRSHQSSIPRTPGNLFCAVRGSTLVWRCWQNSASVGELLLGSLVLVTCSSRVAVWTSSKAAYIQEERRRGPSVAVRTNWKRASRQELFCSRLCLAHEEMVRRCAHRCSLPTQLGSLAALDLLRSTSKVQR